MGRLGGWPPQVLSIGDIADEIADELGVYGSHEFEDDDGFLQTDCTEDNPCRVCFTGFIEDKFRKDLTLFINQEIKDK